MGKTVIANKTRVWVDRYFSLVTQRKLTAAKRALDEIAQQVRGTPWQKGYIIALRGMLDATTIKGDTRPLINNVNFSKYSGQHVFRTQANNELHDDFDRGFFTAWAEFVEQVVEKQTQMRISSF
ncbi:MAG: hypothetical protein JSV76_07715 [Candidatus Bathyarchaeota archaeon]|nr:MAG: hypothetical protein JSV76_07715 [Candidatus Bathyarchaeota archaeon]